MNLEKEIKWRKSPFDILDLMFIATGILTIIGSLFWR